jgi:hypothetical protein
MLRARPFVDGVSHYGRIMRVAVRGAAEPESMVREALATAGYAVHRLGPGRASVEDAFVSMVREDEATRAGAKGQT